MRRLYVLFAPLVFLSCGINIKRAAVPAVPPVRPIATLGEFQAASSELESEREDSFEEAAEFHLLKRAPTGQELPIERYLEARRHADRMPLYSLAQRRSVGAPQKGAGRDANLGAWEPVGPGNIGGRTRSLLIHPNDGTIMYAGSVGGGVWKTTDGGASWTSLTDLLPSIGISALAIDQRNPDVLYAGTGESYTGDTRGDSIRGAGIFKSIDAGATWARLLGTTPSSFYYVNKIVISPNDSKRLWVATWTGVWVSFDAGETWRNDLSRFAPFNGCQDLVIRTDKTEDYLFAACGTTSAAQTAIFRNANGAGRGSWDPVLADKNMGRTTLALAPSNQSTIYALSASTESGDHLRGLLAVYRSTDNGDPNSWRPQVTNQDSVRLNTVLLTNPREAFLDVCSSGKANNVNQGGYDNAIAVDPLNPEVVWAGGIDVFRSDDGGKNWGIAGFWQAGERAPQTVHSDVHGFTFAPGYNGGDNQTLFVITDGGMYRTDNATAAVATGDRAACPPYNTKIQWRSVNNGYAVTQFYHGAVYPGGATYIGGAQDTGTNRGSDAAGALGWLRINSGDGGYVAIDPNDPNILYAETTELSLVKSINGGANFGSATRGITETANNFLFIAPFEMDPSDSKRLYLGGRTLWRTVDAAANWTEASGPISNTNGSISAIGISPSDPDRVVFGTSAGFVYRGVNALTSDKITIRASSQPRTGFVSHVAFDRARPEIIYVTYSQFKTSAAQNHVYKSTDGGVTWTGIDGAGSTGLPDIPVFTIIVDPQNGSNLYIGTDIGVFMSLDGGATWARDDNPFANAVTETLALDRSAGQTTLIAFTHGRGVWKVTLPGSGAACQYKLSSDSASFPAFAGGAEINVTTGDNCTWAAAPVENIFSVQSPAAGKGNGSFTVSGGLNSTTQPRVGTIGVQGKTVTITQDAPLVASGNDDSASPFAIASFPAVIAEDTSGGMEADSDPVHSCTKAKDFKTLWFKVTPSDTGSMAVRFTNRRFDTGTNAGTVLALYNVAANGAVGSEFGCLLIAQSATGTNSNAGFPSINVRQGQPFLVQVSASGSSLPEGIPVLPGNLILTVTLTK